MTAERVSLMDFGLLQRPFEDDGKLTDDQVREKGFSFFGVQRPWYPVDWKMAVLIEKTYGRQKLIECMCDQRLLLPTYNRAAQDHNRHTREPMALWSSAVVNGANEK